MAMVKGYKMAVGSLLCLAMLQTSESSPLLQPMVLGLGHGILMGVSHVVIAKRVPIAAQIDAQLALRDVARRSEGGFVEVDSQSEASTLSSHESSPGLRFSSPLFKLHN
eukprot:CAMPEP_0179444626 /NCGR_PEP_ID=MMETSP0799-20121207/28062_1 /TAXON_ID=46947 /ORGANISM="Geminigera cryophila, Strain CCMP2564" /LENGTH=108 /DNA_ID=CAMNT_0021231837 /DNA_START=50 /DNA_END=376 /DNA_ORIENTATION=+